VVFRMPSASPLAADGCIADSVVCFDGEYMISAILADHNLGTVVRVSDGIATFHDGQAMALRWTGGFLELFEGGRASGWRTPVSAILDDMIIWRNQDLLQQIIVWIRQTCHYQTHRNVITLENPLALNGDAGGVALNAPCFSGKLSALYEDLGDAPLGPPRKGSPTPSMLASGHTAGLGAAFNYFAFKPNYSLLEESSPFVLNFVEVIESGKPFCNPPVEPQPRPPPDPRRQDGGLTLCRPSPPPVPADQEGARRLSRSTVATHDVDHSVKLTAIPCRSSRQYPAMSASPPATLVGAVTTTVSSQQPVPALAVVPIQSAAWSPRSAFAEKPVSQKPIVSMQLHPYHASDALHDGASSSRARLPNSSSASGQDLIAPSLLEQRTVPKVAFTLPLGSAHRAMSPKPVVSMILDSSMGNDPSPSKDAPRSALSPVRQVVSMKLHPTDGNSVGRKHSEIPNWELRGTSPLLFNGSPSGIGGIASAMCGESRESQPAVLDTVRSNTDSTIMLRASLAGSNMSSHKTTVGQSPVRQNMDLSTTGKRDLPPTARPLTSSARDYAGPVPRFAGIAVSGAGIGAHLHIAGPLSLPTDTSAIAAPTGVPGLGSAVLGSPPLLPLPAAMMSMGSGASNEALSPRHVSPRQWPFISVSAGFRRSLPCDSRGGSPHAPPAASPSVSPSRPLLPPAFSHGTRSTSPPWPSANGSGSSPIGGGLRTASMKGPGGGSASFPSAAPPLSDSNPQSWKWSPSPHREDCSPGSQAQRARQAPVIGKSSLGTKVPLQRNGVGDGAGATVGVRQHGAAAGSRARSGSPYLGLASPTFPTVTTSSPIVPQSQSSSHRGLPRGRERSPLISTSDPASLQRRARLPNYAGGSSPMSPLGSLRAPAGLTSTWSAPLSYVSSPLSRPSMLRGCVSQRAYVSVSSVQEGVTRDFDHRNDVIAFLKSHS